MRILSLVALVAASALAANRPARAQCLDWTPGYHLTGIDGEVRSTAVFDDGSGNGPELYVGGRFEAAGDVAASNIAKWNGTRWAAVGTGRSGTVNALHVWDDGSGPALWAGTDFGTGPAVGNASLVLAKWNGTTWIPVAGGATIFQQVSALTSYDDGSGSKLYIGAGFDAIVGTPLAFTNAVARYDGSTFSAMGNGIYADFAAPHALIVHDDGAGPRLFAGGYNLRPYVNGPASPVWTWDGASWTSDGAGYLFAGTVRSFAERETGTGTKELYASGYETTSFTDTSLMLWNGASWHSVGGNLLGDVSFLLGDTPASGPGVVYVAGSIFGFGSFGAYGLAVWDGQNYSGVGPTLPYPSYPTRLAIYDEGNGPRLFAGGQPNMGIAPEARGIIRLDGASWSTVGTSGGYTEAGVLLDLEVVHETTGNSLYAAGTFHSTSTGNVLRWTGTTLLPTGAAFNNTPSELLAYDDGVHGEQLYAGGSFTSIGGFSMNRVARWDGTYWQPLGTGISLLSGGNSLVNDMTVFDDGSGPRLIAGGRFDLAGGVPASRIAAWDGTSWSALGPGLADQVYALAVYDDGSGPALYAAGSFVISGLTYIARWNGTAWSSVGGGVNGQVDALQVHDDGSGPALYAAGAFTQAGGQPATYVARWNGTAWQSMGSGARSVRALASFDDGSGSGPRLYASGAFITAFVTTANGIAVWDGSAWQPLESGTDSAGYALHVFDDGDPDGPGLFTAGSFTHAGAYASARFARWGRTGAAGCTSSTGTSFCFGDGTGSACPCGNVGASGHGCDNSASSGGAELSAEGQAMISADSVTLRVAGTTPAGAMLFFQGTTQSGGGAGVTFGDGLRCVGGQQYRLAIRTANAGTASFGRTNPGDLAVSIAGNLQPGNWRTRHYQVWYRDAQSFCTSSTFNLSNGLTIRWAP